MPRTLPGGYGYRPNSALYGVVTRSTGELLGRVRLDAPDAPRQMADLVALGEGQVTITVEEAIAADASDGSRRRSSRNRTYSSEKVGRKAA